MDKNIGLNDKVELLEKINEFEKEIYDLKQLIEISKGLNSTLDGNILIESILLTCMGQMLLVKAGIFLQKDIMNDNYLLHRNYKGFELNHRIEYQIAADSKLVVFLQNNFRCYTLEELDNILPDTPCLNTLKAINPDLIVPLSGKGKLNGIIILGDRISENIFSQVEKEYLLDIASLAGIAIDNARLYEMATTDMMTHLKIHHFFKTALADEIKKSLNKKLPLSLIMIDIDHFKNFNDTYGHTCGDLVIINVAEVIMKNIRQSDIASRYGGEEFAVILPGGDISESLIVAKRILKHVETSIVEYDDKELSVTVSIGITQFDPIFDKTTDDIIKRTDMALYQSKENGRNKITFIRAGTKM